MNQFLFWSTLLSAIARVGFGAEYLIELKDTSEASQTAFTARNGGTLTLVSEEGHVFKWESGQNFEPSWDSNVEHVQKNFTIRLLQNPSIIENQDALVRMADELRARNDAPFKDNPEIQPVRAETSGSDALLSKLWGIKMIGADKAWDKAPQGQGIIVAITDSGVDYNHEDLINNMWRNSAEIPGNNADDDDNGFVDDIVGWDFAKKDNRPYDLSGSIMDIVLKGMNPGHGTHVAGVVASRMKNSIGTAGVAPQAKIMACRFINETGSGDTAGAIGAIDYAVKNGAKIINASWGGEKEEGEDDKILSDAIKRAEKKGVIFVAAAGNGKMEPGAMKSVGFDIDEDPVLPASYTFSNMVSVAAIDSSQKIAEFSNFGIHAVKLGAPGVKVMSTVPGNRYQDTILDLGETKVTWDGTSMAAPFVSGALAVIWSQRPDQSYREVIQKALSTTKRVSDLDGKTTTGGRIDLSFIGRR